MAHVSRRQCEYLRRAAERKEWFVEEPLWSFLVASLVAENPDRYIELLCGEQLHLPSEGRVVCEAEPIGTRVGTREGNTVLDIAFGHVGVRTQARRVADAKGRDTLAGITYVAHRDDAWVCFVESKYLSDASCKVTHDPCRNQLTRVIENLLCFGSNGEYPSQLHFVLLTPAVFKRAPRARLYGYKMADYADPAAIAGDIQLCEFDWRGRSELVIERLDRLKPVRWVTLEEVLERAGLGTNLDVVRRTGELGAIKEEIDRRLSLPHGGLAAGDCQAVGAPR
jgi:hypothetical protein